MTYATVQDLIARYDVDVVGDFSTDERDTRLRSGITAGTENNGDPNDKIDVALCDASGDIDIALLSGGRYTREQLDQLIADAATGDVTATNAICLLKRICCDIAMGFLLKRRVICKSDDLAKSIAESSKESLKNLGSGANVLGIPDVIEAGQPELHVFSVSSIESRNNLPKRMPRYFPTEQTRTPGGC